MPYATAQDFYNSQYGGTPTELTRGSKEQVATAADQIKALTLQQHQQMRGGGQTVNPLYDARAQLALEDRTKTPGAAYMNPYDLAAANPGAGVDTSEGSNANMFNPNVGGKLSKRGDAGLWSGASSLFGDVGASKVTDYA